MKIRSHKCRPQLVLIANDELIAGILNRNGLVTGSRSRWTRERATALRSHHKIPVVRPAPEGNEPWLSLNKAAGLLGIAPKTLRLAAETDEIEGGILGRMVRGSLADQRSANRRLSASFIARGRTQIAPRDRIQIGKTSSLQSHRQKGVVMQDRSNSCMTAARGADGVRRIRRYDEGTRVGSNRLAVLHKHFARGTGRSRAVSNADRSVRHAKIPMNT